MVKDEWLNSGDDGNQGGPAPTIISADGSNGFVGGNIATTGILVFGRDQPPPQADGDKLWDEGTAGTPQ